MLESESLLPLIKRGGIIKDVEGAAPLLVIKNLISRIKLPRELQVETLLDAVLEREDLQPTSCGRGVALPHPRNPVINRTEEQLIAIGLTREPVPWHALDGEPVRTVVLIVSANAKSHLHTLSKLNFLCCQEDFLKLLHSGAGPADIEAHIAAAEQAWGSC